MIKLSLYGFTAGVLLPPLAAAEAFMGPEAKASYPYRTLEGIISAVANAPTAEAEAASFNIGTMAGMFLTPLGVISGLVYASLYYAWEDLFRAMSSYVAGLKL